MQAGAPKSFTAGNLGQQVQNQGMVKSVSKRGTPPKVSKFKALIQALKNKFSQN